MLDFKFLKELCDTFGPSGCEEGVANLIEKRISPFADRIEYDKAGNLVAMKRGKKSKKRILYSAHLDEVGMMISSVNEDGTLGFQAVGGIDPRILPSRRVVLENSLLGVIGSMAVHLKKEDKNKATPIRELYIDIGAQNREEALTQVAVGDYATFAPNYKVIGGKVLSKAIDDRAGCFLMCEMLKRDLENDSWFVFTVCEEIGGFGSAAAAYTIEPDVSVVIETTTASDVPGVEGADRVCEQKKGAVLSFIDGSTIYDGELYDLIRSEAEKQNIILQTKTKIAGGNDSSRFQRKSKGTRCAALSLPCRYLHSASTVADISDIYSAWSALKLIDKTL